MFSIKTWLLIVPILLLSCSKVELNSENVDSDIRDPFIGNWTFNGWHHETVVGDFQNSDDYYDINQYQGKVIKATSYTLTGKIIEIQYYDNCSQKFRVLENGDILSGDNSTVLGHFDSNTLELGWSTSSVSVNSGTQTTKNVSITAVKN